MNRVRKIILALILPILLISVFSNTVSAIVYCPDGMNENQCNEYKKKINDRYQVETYRSWDELLPEERMLVTNNEEEINFWYTQYSKTIFEGKIGVPDYTPGTGEPIESIIQTVLGGFFTTFILFISRFATSTVMFLANVSSGWLINDLISGISNFVLYTILDINNINGLAIKIAIILMFIILIKAVFRKNSNTIKTPFGIVKSFISLFICLVLLINGAKFSKTFHEQANKMFAPVANAIVLDSKVTGINGVEGISNPLYIQKALIFDTMAVVPFISSNFNSTDISSISNERIKLLIENKETEEHLFNAVGVEYRDHKNPMVMDRGNGFLSYIGHWFFAFLFGGYDLALAVFYFPLMIISFACGLIPLLRPLGFYFYGLKSMNTDFDFYSMFKYFVDSIVWIFAVNLISQIITVIYIIVNMTIISATMIGIVVTIFIALLLFFAGVMMIVHRDKVFKFMKRIAESSFKFAAASLQNQSFQDGFNNTLGKDLNDLKDAITGENGFIAKTKNKLTNVYTDKSNEKEDINDESHSSDDSNETLHGKQGATPSEFIEPSDDQEIDVNQVEDDLSKGNDINDINDNSAQLDAEVNDELDAEINDELTQNNQNDNIDSFIEPEAPNKNEQDVDNYIDDSNVNQNFINDATTDVEFINDDEELIEKQRMKEENDEN